MTMPTRLTLQGCFYLLDGGTIILNMVDESGQVRQSILAQHVSPEGSSIDKIPGRLYFDGQLIPMRSRLESELLQLLRSAEIQMAPIEAEEGTFRSQGGIIIGEDIRQYLTREPEENIHWARTELIRFVESDQYETFALRVEQAADPARYNVWIAWDNTSRKKIIVRLASMRGIGLRNASELLDAGSCIAQGLRALEVSDLIERYAAKGIPLRTEPEFRWQIT